MTHHEIEDVREMARGRWGEIFTSLVRLKHSTIDGRHRPCPICSTTEDSDRFRVYRDFRDTGGAVCNQCGSWSSGFDFFCAVTGKSFSDAVNEIGDYLDVSPSLLGTSRRRSSDVPRPGKAAAPKPDAEELVSMGSEGFGKVFAEFLNNYGKGISQEVLVRAGGEVSSSGGVAVITVPYFALGAEQGRHIYSLSERASMKYRGGNIKDRLSGGCGKGFAGIVPESKASIIILSEGVKDALAIASLEGFPEGAAVVSQPNGAKANPAKFPLNSLPEAADGAEIFVIYDPDKAGQEGANYVKGRAGWAPALAKHYGQKVRNVVMPGDEDVRDSVNSGAISSFDDLMDIARNGAGRDYGSVVNNPPGQGNGGPGSEYSPQVGGDESHRAIEDPMRIAAYNLNRFYRTTGGWLAWHDRWGVDRYLDTAKRRGVR